MLTTNSSLKELTVPFIPVMTFDEITAVKDFRKIKKPVVVSNHSSQVDLTMPQISNTHSPDKNKKDHKHLEHQGSINCHLDVVNPIFEGLIDRKKAQWYNDMRHDITYLAHDNVKQKALFDKFMKKNNLEVEHKESVYQNKVKSKYQYIQNKINKTEHQIEKSVSLTN